MMSIIVSGDNDDDHHSKLIHRQHKNVTNNDASAVFASIPTGSTIVVQQEDGGLWTHGMIVGKGDHNHHDQSYIIQITTTGRRITNNRQHIRLTSITADEYICYQATKHANRQTDPLDAIPEHIKINPMSYSNRTAQNIINNTHNTNNKQQPKSDILERRKEETQTTINNTGEDNNKTIQQGETIYKKGMEGHSGSQTDYHVNRSDLADKSADLKSHMANCIIFMKEALFHMTFV